MQTHKRRKTLSTKVNILIAVSILLVSAGLVWNSYRIYSKKVFNTYFKESEQAAASAWEDIVPCLVENLWDHVYTEEFREIRKKAVDADDETIIRDWMISKPSKLNPYFDSGNLENESDLLDFLLVDIPDRISLYTDYELLKNSLQRSFDLFDVAEVYIHYEINDVTYNLVNPDEDLFFIGTVDDSVYPNPEKTDNPEVAPTRYNSRFGWRITTQFPIIDTYHDSETRIVGTVGADVDLNHVVREQRIYLLQSAVFVLVLTTAAIICSVMLMRRIAVKPLKLLASAASGFIHEDKDYSKDDVISLPINSEDEIGYLYHEIRSMQNRIVDYTDNMKRITGERERAAAELDMAKKIQAAMLPSVFPAFPDREEFDLYASMTPAKEVGGDFYDFFLVDHDHLCILIADVSDKGVPAALFMMASKILINYRAQSGGTPGEILTDVNKQICKSNNSKMFVTVWMGILNLKTGKMVCANAGHEYPVIRGKDGMFRIFRDKHDLVVGALGTIKYHDYELTLKPGDAIFVYTDGVPEANNDADEFFGMSRMEESLNHLSGEKPEEILAGVKADVDIFAAGAGQFDDLTMLCLEYRGNRASVTTLDK